MLCKEPYDGGGDEVGNRLKSPTIVGENVNVGTCEDVGCFVTPIGAVGLGVVSDVGVDGGGVDVRVGLEIEGA